MKPIDLKLIDSDPRNANVCSEETLAKLSHNIERTRLCPPLIVRPNPNQEGRFVLIDGHHRHKVLTRLGWQSVECQVWDVDDQEAQIALATLNRLHGEDNPRKRAELIDGLTQCISVEELSLCIPESPPEIADLLALLKLDVEAAEQQFKEMLEQEAMDLPVAFTAMVAAADYPTVERALAMLDVVDRGQALVELCSHYLAHTPHQNEEALEHHVT
ncbi:MAG: ParB N-terminal domain-containing protein [Cyanobacteria bacterium HKST-UBA03]|nr:ParB N-terminal domain-containing protein [Cyanobacteria bacterium HKST-UBA05]MCA9840540.1 ParB N-terminal domain-containing protein [Cyanobacteria bacterium HKST-UBA03]